MRSSSSTRGTDSSSSFRSAAWEMKASQQHRDVAGPLSPFSLSASPSDQVLVAVRRLEAAIYAHLSDSEKEALLESFNEFYETYDSRSFAIGLSSVLNTPVKMQIASLIRAVIPSSELEKFDQAMHLCAPRRKPKIAHNSGNRRSTEWFYTAPTRTRPSDEQIVESPITAIHLQPRGGYLGFSISCTKGSHPAVYIARVDAMSPAEECGLYCGDIIIEANDIDFSKVSLEDAEKVLHAARSLHLTVKRPQRSPIVLQSDNVSDGLQNLRPQQTEYEQRIRSLKWTDTFGRPVSPPSIVINAVGDAFSHREGTRKVSLNLKRKGGLGISIRGGAEHGLGIFVSDVDPQSAGELAGIQVGDWIIDVNGRSLESITHSEAAQMLRRHHHLVMTLLHVGKLPHMEPEVSGSQQTAAAATAADQRFYPGSLGRRSRIRQKAESDTFKRSSSLSNLHPSVGRSMHNLGLLEARGQTLLNQRENLLMREHIEQYLHDELTIDALVERLSALFNTYAKLPMFSEVKSALMPQDVRRYEWLLKQKQLDAVKPKHGSLQDGYMSDTSTTSSSYSEAAAHSSSILKSKARSFGQSENTQTDSIRAAGNATVPTAEAVRRRVAESNKKRDLLQNFVDALGDTTATEDEREMHDVRKFQFSATASSTYPSESVQTGDGSNRVPSRHKLSMPVERTPADFVASVPDRSWQHVPTMQTASVQNGVHAAAASMTARHPVRAANAHSRTGRHVVVHKSCKKLGLAIEGGADTREPLPKVAAVQDAGCAYESGLRCGDVILQVDDVPTDGLAHDAVARLIAHAFRSSEKTYIDFVVISA